MRNGAKECVGGQASHKPILDNRITRSIRSVCNKPEWYIVQPSASLYYSLSVANLSSIDVLECQTQQSINIYVEEGICAKCCENIFHRMKISCCQIIPHSTADIIPASLLPSQQLVQGRGKTDFPEIYECCAFYHSLHWKVSLSLIWMQHSPTPATLLIISTDSDQRWGVKKVGDDQSSRWSM